MRTYLMFTVRTCAANLLAGTDFSEEATSNVAANRAAAGDTLRNPPRRLDVTPAQRQHLEGWGREFLCKV
jgi:hypothetical protein